MRPICLIMLLGSVHGQSFYGCPPSGVSTACVYNFIGGDGLPNATAAAGSTLYLNGDPPELRVKDPILFTAPESGELVDLLVTTYLSQASTGSLVITLIRNGVASPLKVRIPANGSQGDYVDHIRAAPIWKGDKISISVRNNAQSASAWIVRIAFQVKKLMVPVEKQYQEEARRALTDIEMLGAVNFQVLRPAIAADQIGHGDKERLKRHQEEFDENNKTIKRLNRELVAKVCPAGYPLIMISYAEEKVWGIPFNTVVCYLDQREAK